MKFVYIPIFVNSDGQAIYKKPELVMAKEGISEYDPRTLDFKGPSDRMRFAIDGSPGTGRKEMITNIIAEDFTGRLSGSELWGVGVSFQKHETIWHTGETFTLCMLLVRANNTVFREGKREDYLEFFIASPPSTDSLIEKAAYDLCKSSDFFNPLRTAVLLPSGKIGAYPFF